MGVGRVGSAFTSVGIWIGAGVFELAAAASSPDLLKSVVARKYTPPATTTTVTAVATTAITRRRFARSALRTSWRSSFRLACSRRCTLVGTCNLPDLCVDGDDRSAVSGAGM